MLDLTQYYPCQIKDKDSGWTYLNQLYSNGQNLLFITTKGFLKRGILEKLQSVLGTATITVETIDSNPELQTIHEIHQKYKDERFDIILGLGGGSVLDSAKVLSVLLKQTNNIVFLADILRDNKTFDEKRLPLILIPTTAGTGAEVTPFATIWDRPFNKKRSFSSQMIVPDCVILDPSLTLSAPIDITIDCALDTCSHAMETLWNRNATDSSVILANEALRLFATSLPEILKNPSNLTARTIMQKASLAAGLAIAISRTAIAHSISYPLTLHFGVPHGLACSFTLPQVAVLVTKYKAWAHCSDKKAIADALSVIELVDVKSRIQKYCSYEQILSLCEEMTTKDRAENFVLDNFNPKQIFL